MCVCVCVCVCVGVSVSERTRTKTTQTKRLKENPDAERNIHVITGVCRKNLLLVLAQRFQIRGFKI